MLSGSAGFRGIRHGAVSTVVNECDTVLFAEEARSSRLRSCVETWGAVELPCGANAPWWLRDAVPGLPRKGVHSGAVQHPKRHQGLRGVTFDDGAAVDHDQAGGIVDAAQGSERVPKAPQSGAGREDVANSLAGEIADYHL